MARIQRSLPYLCSVIGRATPSYNLCFPTIIEDVMREHYTVNGETFLKVYLILCSAIGMHALE